MATKKTDATGEESVVVETVTEPAFDKRQLTGCARYANRKDLINALLEEGKTYTFSQVDGMIKEFDGGNFTERKGD